MTNWIPNLDGRKGPRYLSIASALSEDIRAGRLAPGTRMPTHRELAYQLGVTVGTVSRAYSEATNRGLIDGEVGRGTFVRARPQRDMSAVPTQAPTPNGVDLGLNYPPLGIEETEALRDGLRAVAESGAITDLVGYAPHKGLPRHREACASWLERLGLTTEPARVAVTSGAQHGTLICMAALCEPGDVVLVDRHTYPGMLAAANMLRIRVVPVAMDTEGIDPDAFQQACAQHAPKAYYAMPTLHNPTTSTLSTKRRGRLVDIAARYGVTIVEDDIYRFLIPDAPPPLAELAPDSVIFVTTAAKQLMPGLRVGALSAPPPLLDRIEGAMRVTTWMAPSPMAEILYHWIEDGTAERLTERKRTETRARADIARERFAEFGCPVPESTMHVWLEIPDHWHGEDATTAIARRGVAVSSGKAFSAKAGHGENHLRICLGNPKDRAAVASGLDIVAHVLRTGPGSERSIV